MIITLMIFLGNILLISISQHTQLFMRIPSLIGVTF